MLFRSYPYNKAEVIVLDFILDQLLDTVHDTWTMLLLLYAAYLIIDYYERRPAKDDSLFFRLQKYGPFFGALVGLLPQCGFSVLAAMLFCQHSITIGTLVAVFLATSDEAIPVLITMPDFYGQLGILLILKLCLGAGIGWLVDRFLFPHQKILSFDDLPEEEEGEEEFEEDEEQANSIAACPCCRPELPVWQSALLRTLKIWLFIFLTTFVLNLLVGSIGEETLSKFLLLNSPLQPVLAALFGFIPNCAATVVLCELFAGGQLSFGSLLAGLMTNAGLGMLVLVQYGAPKKKIWQIFWILLISASLCGLIVQLA